MSFTLNTGLMASNYAGNTKKSAANGVIFAGWAAGLVAGPREYDQRYTHVLHTDSQSQNSSLKVRHPYTILLSKCSVSSQSFLLSWNN
jgi:hypothetical protein